MRRALAALLRSAIEAGAVLVILASLVFFALRLLPGDPAALVLGDRASEVERQALRRELHFDEPIHVQYARFVRGLPSLDFGESLRRPGVTARQRVLVALGPTSALAGLAVALGAIFGVGLAVLSIGPWLGSRRAWVERIFVAIAATPLIAFAPLLTYALAARARVVPLPGDPEAGALGLLFASGLLALPLGAHVGRIARVALSATSRAQFLAVARAKGASEARVVLLHALPASLGPIVTVIAAQLGALLGGAVVLERLFERPGLGTLILESYQSRDLPVLEAAVIAAGALFVVAQAVASSLHAVLDPRVRA